MLSKSRPLLSDIWEVKLLVLCLLAEPGTANCGICGAPVCCGGEWVLGSGLQTCAGALLVQSLLPFQELVGWCQLGGLQNVSLEYLRHITPGLDSACVSIRCSDAQPSTENSFLLLHNSEENVSQVKALPPLRSG